MLLFYPWKWEFPQQCCLRGLGLPPLQLQPGSRSRDTRANGPQRGFDKCKYEELLVELTLNPPWNVEPCDNLSLGKSCKFVLDKKIPNDCLILLAMCSVIADMKVWLGNILLFFNLPLINADFLVFEMTNGHCNSNRNKVVLLFVFL